MRRPLALAALLAAATSAAFLAAGVTPARASTGTWAPPSSTEPMFNPDNQEFVSAVLSDLGTIPTTPPPEWTNPADGGAITSTEVSSGMAELETAAGTSPSLLALAPQLALGVAGVSTGYLIGSAVGGPIRRLIAGGPAFANNGTGILVASFCASGSQPGGESCGSQALSYGTGFAFGGTTTWPKGAVLDDKGYGNDPYYCLPYNVAGCTLTATFAETPQQHTTYMDSQPGTRVQATTTSPCGTTSCYVKVMTEEQLERNSAQSAPQTDCTGATSGTCADYSGFSPGTPNVSQAQQRIENHQTDPNLGGARAAIDHLIDPTWTPTEGAPGSGGTGTTAPAWAPIYLPQPLPGETFESYFERLRAKTWVGTAAVVDDTMAYPTGAPALALQSGSITQISVGTSTVMVMDPATGQPVPWPITPPQIDTTTEQVTITKVPDGWVPAGPGNGGAVPPISMPTIKASPCTTFPFGVFCWVKDQLSTLFGAPVIAPNISMTVPSTHVHLYSMDYTIPSYSFGWDFGSTTAFDNYLSTIRDVLAYLLWLGGLFFLGSRLLSIRGAPDTAGSGTELGDGSDGGV